MHLGSDSKTAFCDWKTLKILLSQSCGCLNVFLIMYIFGRLFFFLAGRENPFFLLVSILA